MSVIRARVYWEIGEREDGGYSELFLLLDDVYPKNGGVGRCWRAMGLVGIMPCTSVHPWCV